MQIITTRSPVFPVLIPGNAHICYRPRKLFNDTNSFFKLKQGKIYITNRASTAPMARPATLVRADDALPV
jgi:hypothetical protein